MDDKAVGAMWEIFVSSQRYKFPAGIPNHGIAGLIMKLVHDRACLNKSKEAACRDFGIDPNEITWDV